MTLSFTGHELSVFSLSLSPDGAYIASASADKSVRIWDSRSGAELAVLTGHSAEVTTVAYAPDGQRLVSGSFDKTLIIWGPQ